MEVLIQYCLKLLCDPEDKERYFVNFEKDDSTILVINNYGGMSNLELGALTDETMIQLGESARKQHRPIQIIDTKCQIASKWDIKPVRTVTGTFETSLNAPGFSISLCNLSAASRESGTSVDELLELFDAPTTAVGWPNLTSSTAYQNGASQKQHAQPKAKINSNDGADIIGGSMNGRLVSDRNKANSLYSGSQITGYCNSIRVRRCDCCRAQFDEMGYD